MKKIESSVIEALEQALAVEQTGREFYEKALARTRNQDGRRIYENLIEDEKLHYRILIAEYNSLRGGGEWLPLRTAQEIPAEMVLFPRGTAAELVLKDEATDAEALELAMDFERKGYEMYKREAEQNRDLNARAVYDFLARKENDHFALLQQTRDYLNTRGAWMFDDLQKPHID